MPPKGRKGKKKVGKRTVALAKAALSHILSDEQDTSDNLKPLDVESKLAEMEEEMREKGEKAGTPVVLLKHVNPPFLLGRRNHILGISGAQSNTSFLGAWHSILQEYLHSSP